MDTILPHELPAALSGREAAKVLSLDCFDTLLWRDCHAPVGVFAALPGLTEAQRIVAEQRARKAALATRGRSEVSLAEIYAQAMPNASGEERAEAMAAELAAEAAHCFAFAPTVALMRTARQRGIEVVVVSDTYLDEAQLLALIEQAAGEEVAAMIDHVFCSSTHGLSKAQGLFAPVLKALKCAPAAMLHLGDNKAADFDGARALGIPALHLLQFSEDAKQRLRFEEVAASLIGPAKGRIAAPQPHRAVLAMREPALVEQDAERLGFTALGPVFHAFDRWLEAEAEALQARHGGTVHWLFLMRDGYLPREVHRLADRDAPGAAVEISRFVATAASLTDAEVIARHAAQEFGLKPVTLARQMLFAEEEIARLVDPDDHEGSARRLHAELKTGQCQKRIRRRARAFAERLVAHVRNAVTPAPGDVLMLVDLGYNGSAQNRVDALLREAFGCHVAGRYLLLREMDAPGLDKRGMVDARHYDPRLLEAMCANVAVLEQLSTVAMGSAIDFTDAGTPVRKDSGVKGKQSAVREQVQQGCLDFCRIANDPPLFRRADPQGTNHWREAGCAALLRLMFLPLPQELRVVSAFEHDVNLGSERIVPLFDPAHAREGLRRRGLFYMKGSERMYLPAELAEEDLSTRLSLLAQKRFGLGLTYQDFAPASMALPVIHIAGAEARQSEVQARPTQDGYWTLTIPIGAAKYSVAVQFGATFEWVEIASITASPVAGLKGGATNDQPPIALPPIGDEIEQHAPGLFRCLSDTAMVLVSPPSGQGSASMVVEVVFRPIAHRAEHVCEQSAPALGEAA